ncbi:hypothetical protein D3C84_1150270 [compost metagenome]
MTEQQAHFTEVRQLTQLGHAQAEGFATAQARRFFQQDDAGGGRDTLALIAQHRGAQADFGQQGDRVQP